MALPQVGLEAVIAGLPGFEAGARTITKAYDDIDKKGANVAKASSSLSSSISSLASPFTSIGQSVLNFGAIAGGAALLGVGALTAGIGALGIAALGEVAKFERMSLSIQNLVAREISQGKLVEQQVQARIQLTQKEVAELEKLRNGLDNEANDRDVLTARIQEQKERIRQLTEQYGENGLVVIKERAELQGMELDLADLNGEIETNQRRITELTSKNGQLTTVLQKVRVGQMSMSEAMELASPRAQELIKWVQLLGIQSPFTSDGIQAAFQTALAYGFTSEQAQRLTEAEVDFVAATGKTAQSADLIALALGQIQARGKLSAQELRQLSEQGVGVNKILEDMGFTLDDVSAGLVDSDAFIEAVITDMEVFKGAAKDQANTFSGLITSLGEIKSVALREFFTGTFKAIQPYLADFVSFLTNAALQTGSIKAIGDAIGQAVGGGLAKVAGWIRIISTMGAGGGLSILNEIFGPAAFSLWRELSDLVKNISRSFSGVGTSLRKLMPSFSELSSIILPAITTALAFVNDHFEEFKGALFGIGTVLGIGVFAAITAGLISLLTPINLIIAGAALLGAAWMGNWGGIRDIVLSVWSYIQPVFDMLQQRADLVIFTFEKFGMSQGFATLGKQIVAVINMIIPGFADVVTWLQTNIPIAVQVVSDIWTNNLLPGFVRVWEAIETNLIPIFNQLVSWLGTQTPGATQVLVDFWNNTLLPALAAVGNFLINTLFPAWVETQVWLAQNIPVAIQFLTDAWNTVLYPALVTVGNWITTTLVPILTDIYNWLYTNIPIAIQALSDFWTNTLLPALTSVGDYISTNLTPLMKAMNDFILAVFNVTLSAMAGLWQNIIYPALQSVYDVIAKNLQPVFVSLGDFISNSITPKLDKLGKDTFPMLSKALQTVTRWIKEATNFFKSMANAVNNFRLPEVLQEHSPSPFAMSLIHIADAADRAGLSMQALGNITQRGTFDKLFKIDRSITEFPKILQEARRGLEAWGKERYIGPEKVNYAINRFREFFTQDFDKIMASENPLATFQDMVANRVNWRKIGLKAEDAQALGTMFFDNFFKESERRAEKLTDMIISGSQQAIQMASQLNQFASQQTEYLQSQVDTLQEFVESGEMEMNFEGRIISAAQAQELLNQKLEDQKAIQDDILQIKQQESKLQFLESQLDLIKMVRDAGLNVREVLGGITLGLDASIPDMLAATNNVIQAIIGQVDSDLSNITQVGEAIGNSLSGGVVQALGIASPSKVMKWIAKQTVGGFVDEMLAQAPNLISAVQNTIVVPTGQLMSGIGGNTSNVTNNNFNMTVSALSSPQAVMQQYQVMRAMV